MAGARAVYWEEGWTVQETAAVEGAASLTVTSGLLITAQNTPVSIIAVPHVHTHYPYKIC